MTPEQFQQNRLSLGLTPEQLADKLGVHRTSIGRYEKGYRKINLTIIKLFDRIIKEEAK